MRKLQRNHLHEEEISDLMQLSSILHVIVGSTVTCYIFSSCVPRNGAPEAEEFPISRELLHVSVYLDIPVVVLLSFVSKFLGTIPFALSAVYLMLNLFPLSLSWMESLWMCSHHSLNLTKFKV